MAQVLVLYNAPTDPQAFQSHYETTHKPLAMKIPGLKSLTVSDGGVQGLAGNPAYLVAILTFDSMATLQAGMGSAEGQAAAADVQNFASGGASIMVYETRTA